MTRLRSSPLLLALGAAAVLALVLLAVALAGGGEAAATGPDPARLTPPRVAVFADVSLHPPGEEGTNARALLARALGGPDPGASLAGLVKRAVDGGRGETDYRTDVKPWLGSRAGVFFRTLAGPRSHGTLLLAARDEALARRSLVTAPAGGVRRSYRGVTYAVRRDGTVAAVLDGFALIGDEGGVRAAVDAARGYSLAGSDRFQTRLRRLKGDRVGLVYFDLLSFGDILRPGLVPRSTGRQLRERLAITDPDPIVAVISAKQRALIFDFGPRPGDTVPGAPQGAGADQGDGGTPPGEAGGGANQPVPGQPGAPGDGSAPEAGPGSGSDPGAPGAGLSLLSSPLLPELPADAWLAIGVPDFGQRLGALLDPSIDQSLPLDALTRAVRRLAGSRAREDVVPALGAMAIFVRGTDPRRLEGAAVIESLDSSATRPALRRIAKALNRERGWRSRRSDLAGAYELDAPRVSQPVYLLARGNRIVAAVGRAAAVDALDAPRKLGTTRAFRSASAILAPSLRPDSFLDLQAALRVLDRSRPGRSSAYRTARPLLNLFSYAVFASKNRIRRLALGVR